MRVAVWSVGEWIPSRHGEGNNKVVVFKDIDTTQAGAKEYHLNLTDYETNKRTGRSVKDEWDEACKVGNVLDVVIFSNGKNVNKFEPFRIIKLNEAKEDN